MSTSRCENRLGLRLFRSSGSLHRPAEQQSRLPDYFVITKWPSVKILRREALRIKPPGREYRLDDRHILQPIHIDSGALPGEITGGLPIPGPGQRRERRFPHQGDGVFRRSAFSSGNFLDTAGKVIYKMSWKFFHG